MAGIKASLLKQVEIAYPDLLTQESICDTLGSLAKQCTQLEGLSRRKLAALAELKQSLLTRAFSGELRTDRALAA